MNLEAIKMQMAADRLRKNGDTEEACRLWELAAATLEASGSTEAAKALRERVAHIRPRALQGTTQQGSEELSRGKV